MSREYPVDDIQAALRFVQRLARLPEEYRRPALPPLMNVDPYLSARTNVEAGLGNASSPERERRLAVAAELDGAILRMDLTPESFKFVYEPFETLIPVDSL